MGFKLFIVFLLLALSHVFNAQVISTACLGCICHVLSSCNATIGCAGNACGPFYITKPYWADVGSLTVNDADPSEPLAYENCANDIFCAGNTVKAYMSKYARDCDGNGIINCEDYAKIHAFGGYSCNQPLRTEYVNQLKTCMLKVLKLVNVSPEDSLNY